MKNLNRIIAAMMIMALAATLYVGCGGGSGGSSSKATVINAIFINDTGALKAVPLTGGDPITLVDTGVAGCLMSENKAWVVYLTDNDELMSVRIGGGDPVELDIEHVVFYAEISPNSAYVVYVIDKAMIYGQCQSAAAMPWNWELISSTWTPMGSRRIHHGWFT